MDSMKYFESILNWWVYMYQSSEFRSDRDPFNKRKEIRIGFETKFIAFYPILTSFII